MAAVSGGVPRVVNRVCDLALGIGQQRQTRVIDARIVRAAARRLNVSAGAREWPWKTPPAAAAAFTLVAGAAMASWGPFSAGPVEAGAAASTGLVCRGGRLQPARPILRRRDCFYPDFERTRGTYRNARALEQHQRAGRIVKSADRAAAVAAQVKALGCRRSRGFETGSGTR